jgi:hypothetical protein
LFNRPINYSITRFTRFPTRHFGEPEGENRRRHAMMVEKSDHFDGRRFVNPTGAVPQPFSAVPRMLLERRTRWPARVEQAPRRSPGLDGAVAVVTFIGHSTFLIQTTSGNILTDPMYSQRAVATVYEPMRK